MSVSVYNHRTR